MMHSSRVLVLYNEPTLPPDHPDADSEHDILYTSDVISKILIEAGYPVTRLGVSDDSAALLAGLREHKPDVVFNLYEGTAKYGNTEAYVAGLLEWLGIPFTGSPSQALWLARSKPLTKHLLAGAGISTSAFFVIDQLPVPRCTIDWPVIVKPGREDASVGIDQQSVVTSQKQLEDRVEYILNRYGAPVLVEQFIGGREFNVGLIELPDLQVLPFSEIMFIDKTPGYWPLVTFDAKWKPGTRDFQATPPVNPAEVDPDLREWVETIAIRSYQLVGCRDYARVDVRVDEKGRPYVLEVNPNPCISPLAGFAEALKSAKIPHAQFVVELVRMALQRGGTTVPGSGSWETPSSTDHTTGNNSTGAWQVRPARSTDRPAILELLDRLEGFRPEERELLRERLLSATEKGRRTAARSLVLASRGRIGGFICWHQSSQPFGVFVLDGFGVDRELRGRKWSRKLLEEAEQIIRQAGGRLIFAELSSRPEFVFARHALFRLGYRVTGDVPDFYRDGSSRLSYVLHLKRNASRVGESAPQLAAESSTAETSNSPNTRDTA